MMQCANVKLKLDKSVRAFSALDGSDAEEELIEGKSK
jgi:hypothetical protein